MIAAVDVVVAAVRVRPGLERGRGAADDALPHATAAREVLLRPLELAPISLLLPAIAGVVQTERMDVKPAPADIGHQETAGPLVALRHTVKLGQRPFQRGKIASNDGEIQIVVKTRLRAEKGVHPPSTMNPPVHAGRIQAVQDVEYFPKIHDPQILLSVTVPAWLEQRWIGSRQAISTGC